MILIFWMIRTKPKFKKPEQLSPFCNPNHTFCIPRKAVVRSLYALAPRSPSRLLNFQKPSESTKWWIALITDHLATCYVALCSLSAQSASQYCAAWCRVRFGSWWDFLSVLSLITSYQKGQPEPDDELEQIGMDMPVYTINGNPIPPPPSYQMLFKDMAW